MFFSFMTSIFTSFIPASGIDLIAAFYGCLYAGCVPVNVRPPHPQNLAATLPTVRMIIDVSHCLLFVNHMKGSFVKAVMHRCVKL